MAQRRLADVLRSTKPPWVVRRTVKRSAAAPGDLHGLLLRSVDGARCRSREGLLREFAAALEFPVAPGEDWNVLEEALTDLEWLPARGYALVVRDADLVLADAPGERRALLGILELVGRGWADHQAKPFHTVLIVGDTGPDAQRVWPVPAADG